MFSFKVRIRPHPRHRKKKHLPLTERQWRNAFEAETGRLMDGQRILKRVRYGGIEPSIRAEVWLFLLNFYEMESTHTERKEVNIMRREEYASLRSKSTLLRTSIASKLKSPLAGAGGGNTTPTTLLDQEAFTVGSLQGTSTPGVIGMSVGSSETSCISKSSVSNVVLDRGHGEVKEEFSTWQRIIRLDAIRMNAEWVPYSPSQASITTWTAKQRAMDVGLQEDEHLEPCVRHHAARLVGILEAYALYDPETGYCQGMGDLLSPFVALFDEDYQAFWCFTNFMSSARHNFQLDEVGIQRQLRLVSKILRKSDPQLFKHFEMVEAADCFFVYRMIVVLLRRELTFKQVISFWEVLWADKTAMRLGKVKMVCRKRRKRAPPTDDLLLYVIAGAVQRKRKTLMESCLSMDDILKECNSMSGSLDVWTLLDDARDLIASFC